MKKNEPLEQVLIRHPLWEKENDPIWIATRFCLSRNFAFLPFPEKMNEIEKKELFSFLMPSLANAELLKEGSYFDAATLATSQKKALAEHFLIDDLDESLHYFIDEGSFLATIGGKDHLSLHCLDAESDWVKSWEKLSGLETAIGKIHSFAFTPQFGYLTSDPASSGTALKIQAFLHLPSLIHLENIGEILENELLDEVQIFKLDDREQPTGDIVILENRFSLGLSEEHILESVHKVAGKLLTLEKAKREKLRQSPSPLMIDKISRAYGLLLHSYQIGMRESLEALGLLKLAIDLKWASGVTDRDISRIFVNNQRGHLALFSKEELTSDNLAKRRAESLREECKKIELKFQ